MSSKPLLRNNGTSISDSTAKMTELLIVGVTFVLVVSNSRSSMELIHNSKYQLSITVPLDEKTRTEATPTSSIVSPQTANARLRGEILGSAP